MSQLSWLICNDCNVCSAQSDTRQNHFALTQDELSCGVILLHKLASFSIWKSLIQQQNDKIKFNIWFYAQWFFNLHGIPSIHCLPAILSLSYLSSWIHEVFLVIITTCKYFLVVFLLLLSLNILTDLKSAETIPLFWSHVYLVTLDQPPASNRLTKTSPTALNIKKNFINTDFWLPLFSIHEMIGSNYIVQ